MKVSFVQQIREMDRAAIEDFGIDEIILMENAGAGAFRVLAQAQSIEQQRGLVVCGGGNNGGDGLVAARHIHAAGGAVRLVLLSEPDKFKGAAAANAQIIRRLGLETTEGFDAPQFEELLAQSDYIVDAIFGTGLARGVEGDYAAAIEAINQASSRAGKPVLSLDIPSGVQGDTGCVMNVAIQATWTVTFGLPKPGNLLFPGHRYGGKLFVTHISFPRHFIQTQPQPLHVTQTQRPGDRRPEISEIGSEDRPPSPVARRQSRHVWQSNEPELATNEPLPLPPRDPDGHKSSFGQALFVAGAASYYGAPHFSALSFMRAGGGYSRLATPRSLAPHLSVGGREIVYLPQSETEGGAIALENAAQLIEMANRMDFVVVGPGISLEPEAQELAVRLVQAVEKPLLVDGDGLTALVGKTHLLAKRAAPTVLTPHLGEMARLTGHSVDEIRQDRIGVLRAACGEWQSIVVLKGAHSLVGLPDGRVFINLSGNSGMGSAGSGDVLTGIIGAMVGLGLSVEDATRMGVFMHGVAGDLAAQAKGEDGMTAQDLLDHLPYAMQAARAGNLAARYAIPVIS